MLLVAFYGSTSAEVPPSSDDSGVEEEAGGVLEGVWLEEGAWLEEDGVLEDACPPEGFVLVAEDSGPTRMILETGL